MSTKWPVLTLHFLSLSLGGHKFSCVFLIPFFFSFKIFEIPFIRGNTAKTAHLMKRVTI